MNVFNDLSPRLVIDDKGAGWIFDDAPEAFNDQILLIGGQPFAEPRVAQNVQQGFIIFGAYRVKNVTCKPLEYRTLWEIHPYEDGWTRFEHLKVDTPRYQKLDGPYVREIERGLVSRVFDRASQKATDPHRQWTDSSLKKRFRHFHAQIDQWLEHAKEVTPNPARSQRSYSKPVYQPTGPLVNTMELPAGIHQLVKTAPEPSAAPEPPEATSRPVAAPADTPTSAPQPIAKESGTAATGTASTGTAETATAAPDESKLLGLLDRNAIDAAYGPRVTRQVQIAVLTKDIVIFAGGPGTGKSYLAQNLVDAESRVPTCVVPVASTWRGREDLLGYVNPINHQFEPTPFTRFLLDAETAWDAGDFGPRVVVFEEFNLSPPEFWFSEVLARSQFQPNAKEARRIDLGGSSVHGFGVDRAKGVYLSPAITFIATINNDHSTRELSPRVLDRSAIVNVSMDVEAALSQAGVQELNDDQVEALKDLDFLLGAHSAGFSIRSAISLSICLKHSQKLGIEVWGAVDTVLTQEVLSKVHLIAGDPRDEELCEKLKEWVEDRSSQLASCARQIETFSETLQRGQDVIQA